MAAGALAGRTGQHGAEGPETTETAETPGPGRGGPAAPDPAAARAAEAPAAPPSGLDAGDGVDPSDPAEGDGGPRQLGRRRGRSGSPVVMPGTAPRMRPRRAGGDQDDAEGGEAQPGEGLFAPSVDGGGSAPASPPQAPAGGTGSANGTNGTNGVGAPRPATPTGRAAPDRVPMRAATPTREKTPIFDEVASVWFREAPPAAPADDDAAWATTGDAGWRAAAASTADADAGTTEAGLPRRRPRARLVPGAAGTEEAQSPAPVAASSPSGAHARRDPDAIRGRLASYQQGVSDGRTSRQGRQPDTGADDASGARPGEQEEQ
jgi:hypothetical protein